MRIRYVLAIMVAGLLLATGVASAQDTSTLSDYTTTTPTVTTPTTETAPVEEQGAEPESTVAPTVAAEPAGEAPSELAFTGAEPLLLIAVGAALAGGALVLLTRDRRRTGGS